MKKIIHRAGERGQRDYGWLRTNYSFSFADWYEPRRMGFGTLRVLNDDTIAPNTGFDAHSHSDMEIVTIVMEGTVTHEDNMGNIGKVSAGEVQTMSAGTGVTHSERNTSLDTPLSLFQIWIEPGKRGISPRYGQKSFVSNARGLILLVSPDGKKESLSINQNAYIVEGTLDSKHPIKYSLQEKGNGIYIFVIEGNVTIDKETLGPRDAVGIEEAEELEIETDAEAKILVIEVPMISS